MRPSQSLASRYAPALIRSRVTARWPPRAERCRAVEPSTAAMETLAPLPSKIQTTREKPSLLAIRRGVKSPRGSPRSMFIGPLQSTAIVCSAEPRLAASCSSYSGLRAHCCCCCIGIMEEILSARCRGDLAGTWRRARKATGHAWMGCPKFKIQYSEGVR